MKKTPVLLIALFIFTPLCHGADVYVNGSTGTDIAWCGVIASLPCKTVGRGVAKAGSGTNVVKIAVGNYSENVKIDYSIAGLTLQGGWNADFSAQNCNPDLTVLQQRYFFPVLTLEPLAWRSISANISCLTFRGVHDTNRVGIELITRTGTNSSITLNMDQSIIDGFAGSGIDLLSETSTAIDVTIHNSVLKNAYQPPAAHSRSGGGIRAVAWGGSDQTINLENCLLFNNEAYGGAAIDLSASGSGSTVHLSLTNVTLAGNRFLDPDDDDGGGLSAYSANSGQTTVDITNSIVWGNLQWEVPMDIIIFQYSSGTSTVNARYSIVGEIEPYPSSPGTYNDNGHNLNIDPRLNSSYHLTPGSPAIDAALCGYYAAPYYLRVAPYGDIDGDQRPGIPKVAGCDIGADEWRVKAMPWQMLLLD